MSKHQFGFKDAWEHCVMIVLFFSLMGDYREPFFFLLISFLGGRERERENQVYE